MEIRPILSALLRSKTGAAAGRAAGRAQPGDPRQRAVHRATCASAVAARPSGIADESTMVYIDVRHLDKRRRTTKQLAEQQRDAGGAARACPAWRRWRGLSQMPMSRSGSTSSVARRPQAGAAEPRSAVVLRAAGLADRRPGPEAGRGPRLHRRTTWSRSIRRRTTSNEFPQHVDHHAARWPRSCSRAPPASSARRFYFGTGDDARRRARGRRGRAPADPRRRRTAPDGEYSVILPLRARPTSAPRYAVRAEPGQRDA